MRASTPFIAPFTSPRQHGAFDPVRLIPGSSQCPPRIFPVPNELFRHQKEGASMISYIISHELRQQDDRQEANIVATLEVFEDRCKALASIWFVSTDWTAEQVRSHLQPHLQPEDSLIVEP